MSAKPIIEAEGLTRHYGDRVAVDHVDFAISRGEVFGFLGPNGAGKSTTIRMLTGYISPTDGTARIAGCDIVAEPVAARQHIGVNPASWLPLPGCGMVGLSLRRGVPPRSSAPRLLRRAKSWRKIRRSR